ncbi:fluoride efflux transporter CrcB [Alginatibacterium sediminis]|uniref:Fluoride-specific ion channel FluC n=1 Tax=Alginatibacterium sediminis TaxID=2164068 RepID=A0A420EGP3_9ALTE|nr:fluoride efflux transporter CrcB [Alginatibacterium sediminis]RKF19859.1 fluoride efflux transporter CrcB [Alginatibacterium sediminis]
MWISILAISVGASLGATTRWGLGNLLNSMFPTIPPGTLIANLIGGYLIGVAMTIFSDIPNLAPEIRLLVITGFLGGLTTFSSFSAEMSALIQQGRYAWAMGGVAMHTFGSISMTILGIFTVNSLRQLS